MTILSPQLLERVRSLADRGPLPPWPAVLLDEGVGELDERVEAAVSWMRGAREAVAAAWMQGSGDGLVGLGRLWSLSAAAASGWDLAMVGPRSLTVRREGRRAVLLPVSVPTAAPDDVRVPRLQRRLSPLFEDRPWALIVRRPLPDDFDAERIIEPVRMWLAALDRGRWDGDYAIYEDGGVSLELRVLTDDALQVSPDTPALERPGLVMRLPRADADLQIDDVRERLIAAVEAADTPDGLPVIPVLVRGAPWRLPRRRRLELLYGKLEESTATSTGGASVTFRRSEASLLGRRSFERVAGVWWLGADPTDPLSPRGWADENPWGRHPGEGPRFPGGRLSVVATGPDEEGAPASLSWVPGGPVPR